MSSRYFLDEQAVVLHALTQSSDACTAAELADITGLPIDEHIDPDGRAAPSVLGILELLEMSDQVQRGNSAWTLADAAPDNPAAPEHELTGGRIRALLALRDVPWPRTPRGLAQVANQPSGPLTGAVNWLVRNRREWVTPVPTWELVLADPPQTAAQPVHSED
ncbi:hypothetical protein [Nocardia terpenica]|uniref:Uncharacterized protein n=1 Tax=Nocardia terpenica TaxID=455432 RepID=A0A6G9Z6I3_9NOCA|nr:hypothetical protein [Nocardia terpenica]QIS21102.1 hypothetical protein F6W96_25060 [Nocardia terpenica]